MVELIAKQPLDGMAPVKIGTVTLSAVDVGVLTSVAPFRGADQDLSEALKVTHGMNAPAPNRITGREGARVIWFGQRMFLLMGPEPAAELGTHAALTDQSDAWTVAKLEGPEAADVLARLTPIDLRPAHFKRGHTARTDLQHMMASITKTSDSTFLILVFRGFAQTLVHDLTTAMEGVAARARA